MNQIISRTAIGTWLKYSSLVLLFLVGLFQNIQLLEQTIIPEILRVFQLGGQSAIERSGIFFAGDSFNDFLGFVRERVPEDSLVIIPRFEQDELFGHEGIMEYFLFPRKIANCSPEIRIEDCILTLKGSSTYILAVDEFPPSEAAKRVKEFISFDAGRGVYIPLP